MNPNDLPEWLTGMQAITWVVTEDVAWTLRAVPKRERETEKLQPINPPKSERVELGPREHGPVTPLSSDQRAAEIGDPDDWVGGVTLELLQMRVGGSDAARHASNMLVVAARAGKLRAIEASGEMRPIDSKQWRAQILIEQPPGKLAMAPGDYRLRTANSLQEVLFARDDVLKLSGSISKGTSEEAARSAVKVTYSIEPPSSLRTKPKPTSEEVIKWYEARVSGWPANKLPPTREQDVSAAQAHFDVVGLRDLTRQARRKSAPVQWTSPGSKGRKKAQASIQRQSGQK